MFTMAYNETTVYATDEELAAEVLFKGYPDSLLEFAFAASLIFMLIGIPGNLITIIALACCKKFRNATALFVINLHICNLTFCSIVLPMTATTYLTSHWVFGKTMCSVYPLLKYALNGTAHFTVVAITVNRYIMVCHPLMYARIYKKHVLILSLISTWAVAFLLFMPSYFEVWGRFDLEPKGGRCTMLPDKNDICPKKFFLCLAFVGPYLIISVCYGRIWWTVRKAAKKRTACIARGVPPPTLSNSGSDTSVADTSRACNELSVYESSTDDDANKQNSPVVLTPGGRSIVQFFTPTFRKPKDQNKPKLPTRKDKKLATMILAILVSFALCHVPIMLLRSLYGEYKSDPVAYLIAHLFDDSAAFISPIIYVIMSSEYRQAYISLFMNLKSNTCNAFKV
ncbi:G-protein coupled receptor moody-like [Anticarsia gemmatalis]|uniref:G-protein coupled receptor moody-like n=1 Tax=Anticarsia gemmatalis TaxID=129554 RepID=UPI003F7678B2